MFENKLKIFLSGFVFMFSYVAVNATNILTNVVTKASDPSKGISLEVDLGETIAALQTAQNVSDASLYKLAYNSVTAHEFTPINANISTLRQHMAGDATTTTEQYLEFSLAAGGNNKLIKSKKIKLFFQPDAVETKRLNNGLSTTLNGIVWDFNVFKCESNLPIGEDDNVEMASNMFASVKECTQNLDVNF